MDEQKYADYSDYYIVAKSDAVDQYEKAEEFCSEIRNFINAQG